MTLTVSFLTTRVQQTTAQDLVKLHRVMNYLYSTRNFCQKQGGGSDAEQEQTNDNSG